MLRDHRNRNRIERYHGNGAGFKGTMEIGTGCKAPWELERDAKHHGNENRMQRQRHHGNGAGYKALWKSEASL